MNIHNNPKQAASLKKALDELIDHAWKWDLSILDTIYHKDMKIHMLAPEYTLHQMNKPNFIELMKTQSEASKPTMWAEYHVVEADDTHGHIIISRKVNLTGTEQKITLSIDFMFEDGRWQITREVIFAV